MIPSSITAAVAARRPVPVRAQVTALVMAWLGVAGLAAAVSIPFPPHQATVLWSLVLPLMAVLAYGRGVVWLVVLPGLVAFFPLLLLPSNGWGNLLDMGYYAGWILAHGVGASRRQERPAWWNHPYAVQAACGMAFAFCYLTLFPVLIGLNPPPWYAEAPSDMPRPVLHAIVFKELAATFALIICAEAALRVPTLRRLLGLPVPEHARQAGFILGAALLFALLIFVATRVLLIALFPDELSQELFFSASGPFMLRTALLLTICIMAGSLIAGYLEQLHAAAATLRGRERDLQTIFASLGEAIIAVDAQGQVMRMNPVAEQFSGWAQDQALGRPLAEVVVLVATATGEALPDPLAAVLTGRMSERAIPDVLLRARDGVQHRIAITVSPVKATEDGILGGVLVFRDIGREVTLQEHLQHSQKTEVIGQLTGGIAHDFNNMLTGIMGAAELLAQSLSDEQPARRYLDIITEAATRAADLTRKLLSSARQQPVASAIVDLHQVVQTVLGILSNTVDRRISISSELTADCALVLGDRSLLENILLNLGINAAHAMPEGGRLVFTTRTFDLTEDGVVETAISGRLAAGRYLDIAVADTGCGIPRELQARIFEPFFTTKPEGQGTGLGLAAALGTIQQHQGAITVESSPGQGSTFRILLPLAKQPLPAESGPRQAIVPGRGCILLVEDEAMLRNTAALFLQTAGYRVIEACDGASAVDLYRERRQEIDLVLLDMMMPKMNGADCFVALRAIDPKVRIVLSSGLSHEKDLHGLREQGLDAFIQKPFRAADLTRVIAEVLA